MSVIVTILAISRLEGAANRDKVDLATFVRNAFVAHANVTRALLVDSAFAILIE
jgi:hypothetical protein